MTSRSRWKRQERETAALVGGKRNPCTGGFHQDVTTPMLAIEQKTRKELPGWLTDAMGQAVRVCEPSQTPAVVLTEVRQGVKAKRFILLRLEDFVELHGDISCDQAQKGVS